MLAAGAGGVPPTGRAGRRPTRAGYALVALGAGLLVLALGVLGLSLLAPLLPAASAGLRSAALLPLGLGALLIAVGWRVVHPARPRARRRRRHR